MTDTSNAIPNPGSLEAQMKGCTCPIIDNHHGQGRPTSNGLVFIHSVGCPVHSPKPIWENSEHKCTELR